MIILGLLKETEIENETYFVSTEICESVAEADFSKQAEIISAALTRVPPVEQVVKIWKKQKRRPTPIEVISEMCSYPNFVELSEHNQIKRSQTLISWASWVMFTTIR